MTESVKFPGTSRTPPTEVHLWPYPIDRSGHEWDFEYEPEHDDKTIKYIRADTATPNYVVQQMMMEAYEAGFCQAEHNKKVSTFGIKMKDIEKIRSRYAASNSDNAE